MVAGQIWHGPPPTVACVGPLGYYSPGSTSGQAVGPLWATTVCRCAGRGHAHGCMFYAAHVDPQARPLGGMA